MKGQASINSGWCIHIAAASIVHVQAKRMVYWRHQECEFILGRDIQTDNANRVCARRVLPRAVSTALSSCVEASLEVTADILEAVMSELRTDMMELVD